MLDQDVAMRYMGPGSHIMAYPLKGKKVYNTVLFHPSKATGDTEGDVWTTTGEWREIMSFHGS
jgi:salicylate hydroxylase